MKCSQIIVGLAAVEGDRGCSCLLLARNRVAMNVIKMQDIVVNNELDANRPEYLADVSVVAYDTDHRPMNWI